MSLETQNSLLFLLAYHGRDNQARHRETQAGQEPAGDQTVSRTTWNHIIILAVIPHTKNTTIDREIFVKF